MPCITELVTETEHRETRLGSEANPVLYALFHILDDLTAIQTHPFQEFCI
jgi:hypothetical protein